MTQRVLSKRKADAVSNGIFLISLAVLIYTDFWWPGILIALWLTMAIRQYLTGRFYDLFMTSLLLLSLFVITLLDLQWDILIPVLLILGGIHIIFREYCVAEGIEEEDPIQEAEREIEDDDDKTA